MEVLKITQLEPNKKYHYISAISGEPGPGVVWFDPIINDYYYKDIAGDVTSVKPGPLTKFTPALD